MDSQCVITKNTSYSWLTLSRNHAIILTNHSLTLVAKVKKL